MINRDLSDVSEFDLTAQQLRVSWRKAHNYYASFATVFYQMKKEFDSGKHQGWTFAMWLGQKAGLPEDFVIKQLNTFRNVIAGEENDKIAEENRRMEIEKRHAKNIALIERNKQIEETKRLQAEARAIKDDAKKKRIADKKENEIIAKRNENNQKAKVRREARKIITNDTALSDLAKAIHSGHNQAKNGRQEWINGTLKSAIAMINARSQFSDDRLFGQWVTQNNIPFKKDEKAALIGFGYDPEKTRKVLEQTDSWSIELIWRNMKKETTVVPIT